MKPSQEHDTKQAKIQKVKSDLDKIHNRISELYEHLNNRPYPFLKWDIEKSIQILSDKHTELSQELNRLCEDPKYGYQ